MHVEEVGWSGRRGATVFVCPYSLGSPVLLCVCVDVDVDVYVYVYVYVPLSVCICGCLCFYVFVSVSIFYTQMYIYICVCVSSSFVCIDVAHPCIPFQVTLDELEEVWPDIRQLLPDVDHARSHVGSFFRVHFTQVLDLVRNKRVVLRAGQAYVHKTNLCSVITKSFREELGRALAIAKRVRLQ